MGLFGLYSGSGIIETTDSGFVFLFLVQYGFFFWWFFFWGEGGVFVFVLMSASGMSELGKVLGDGWV